MNIIKGLILLCLVMLGCSKEQQIPRGNKNLNESEILSKSPVTSGVKSFLRPGLEFNKVQNKFGEPQQMFSRGETNVYIYFYNSPEKHPDFDDGYISGITIFVTNEIVAKWDFNFGRTFEGSSQNKVIKPINIELKIFILTNQSFFPRNLEEARTQLRKNKSKPDFQAPVTSIGFNGESNNAQTISIELSAENSSKLQQLTSSNLSNVSMVILNDELIGWPVLRFPIESPMVISADKESVARIAERYRHKGASD